MPELPEVNYFKKYVDSAALHQTISAVDFPVPKLIESSPHKIREALVASSFMESERIGKYLLLRSSSGKYLIFHFGMTGKPDYYHQGQRPKYVAMAIKFENEYELAFVCPRKIGRIYLADNAEEFIKTKDLGPDAAVLTSGKFKKLIQNRRGAIKGTLMNQNILSGIGNLYADEVLFQSRIHPKIKANQLSEEELNRLYETMQTVLKTVSNCKIEDEPLPPNYLTPHRKKDGGCPHGHGQIKHIKVSGRTTYFCPECQGKNNT